MVPGSVKAQFVGVVCVLGCALAACSPVEEGADAAAPSEARDASSEGGSNTETGADAGALGDTGAVGPADAQGPDAPEMDATDPEDSTVPDATEGMDATGNIDAANPEPGDASLDAGVLDAADNGEDAEASVLDAAMDTGVDATSADVDAAQLDAADAQSDAGGTVVGQGCKGRWAPRVAVTASSDPWAYALNIGNYYDHYLRPGAVAIGADDVVIGVYNAGTPTAEAPELYNPTAARRFVPGSGWDEPVAVGPGIHGHPRPSVNFRPRAYVVGDPAARVVAAWTLSGYTHDVYANVYEQTTGWSSYMQLGSETGDSGRQNPPILAVASVSGAAAHVAWMNIRPLTISSRDIYVRRYDPVSGWQPLQILDYVTEGDALGHYLVQPALRVAADASGNLLLATVTGGSSTNQPSIGKRLWTASYTPAGGWQGVKNEAAQTGDLAGLTLSASGEAVAVITDNGSVTYRVRSASGAWSEATSLSTAVSNEVRAEAEADGSVVAVWPSGNLSSACYRPGAGFGGSTPIASIAGAVRDLELRPAGPNRLLAVWRDDAGSWTSRYEW